MDSETKLGLPANFQEYPPQYTHTAVTHTKRNVHLQTGGYRQQHIAPVHTKVPLFTHAWQKKKSAEIDKSTKCTHKVLSCNKV